MTDGYRNTGESRWVQRKGEAHSDAFWVHNVLQQKWQRFDRDVVTGLLVHVADEWRDVPVVEESK